jgi:hypothetical protein
MQELPDNENTTISLVTALEIKTPKKKFHRFRHSVTFLALVAAAASIALASYIVFVGKSIINSRQTDTLATAALNAASTLTKITVESPCFGHVGLCDLNAEDNGASMANLSLNTDNHILTSTVPVMSINRLYGTLRLSALIADKIRHPFMVSLLARDLMQANRLQKALLLKIYQTKQSIYLNTLESLKRALIERDTTLADLQISLGFSTESFGSSQINAPPSTNSAYVTKDGRYKAGMAIPVPNFEPIIFSTLGDKTKLVKPLHFIALVPTEEQLRGQGEFPAPTAVQIEAIYKIARHKEAPKWVKKTACVALGFKQSQPPSAALLLTFPHGMPNLFHNIHDLMFFKKWQNQNRWRQATGGDVPGSGSLLAAVSEQLPIMSPGNVMVMLIYHWFKLLPTDVDPQRCASLLSCNFTESKTLPSQGADSLKKQTATSPTRTYASSQTESPPINSYLAKDSNERVDELLDRATPGSRGQWSISQIFKKTEPAASVDLQPTPPSALPLFVDEAGNCNLVGCHGFQEDLIRQFFTSVYETNLFAFESLSIAQLLRARYCREQEQIRREIAIEREELNSIEHRLKLSGDTIISSAKLSTDDEKSNARQMELLHRQSGLIKIKLNNGEQSVKQLDRLIDLTLIACENANRVADATYELTAHLFTMSKDGLSQLNLPEKHYIVGKKFFFDPVDRPVSESDFIEAASVRHGQEAKLKNLSPWLIKNMSVLKDLDSALAQSEPSFKEMIGKSMSTKNINEAAGAMLPTTIVFNSDCLLPGRLIKPYACQSYPFANSGIPNGQLFYYCQNALETGNNPHVLWSVLARDVVAVKGRNIFGHPLRANETDWCNQKGQLSGMCPGLACEFQVRSPLPDLSNFAIGSYIRNSSEHLVPQVPPVPAETI